MIDINSSDDEIDKVGIDSYRNTGSISLYSILGTNILISSGINYSQC
jgi:hypothetical protein